jgi:hypothetical protein
MADLNLDINYFDHLKTKRLIGSLGKGSEVLPLKLWCYTAKHYPIDGKLAGHSAEDVEAAIGWWGKSGDCVRAMVVSKFIDEKRGIYFVHNWLTRSGHLAAFSVRASNAAKARWSKVNGAKNGDAQASPSIAQAAASNAPTKPTQPTKPDQPNGRASPPGGIAKAEAEADARNKAVNWITTECPSFLRSGAKPFARLIERLGYDEAVQGVEQARANPDVGNPFAWLEAKLDGESARKVSNRRVIPAQQDG